MREFNTKVAEGDYSITFETDDRKAFEQVQILCRLLIDGKGGGAIPIEWIKNYIEDNTSTMVNPKYVDDTYNYIQFTEKPIDYYLTVMPFQVKIMLKKWRKENDN